MTETLADVMVLCAGLGTRLRPLTEFWPKPLLPVGDRPQLAHVLAHLRSQGVERVVVNTHHLPERFSEVHVPGVELVTLFEPELLGTAGGVANARRELQAPLVVWNGDMLLTPDIEPLRQSVFRGGITLLASPLETPGGGTLGLDANGGVVRLRGERFGAEASAANYTGVLALGKDAFERLPTRGCLVGDLCLPWLRDGGSIATLPYQGAWTDIGTLAEFRRANLAWLEASGLSSYVAPGASVGAGVVLEQSVVHSGARVDGRGGLSRSVVLADAHATAPLADVVVLENGVWNVSS